MSILRSFFGYTRVIMFVPVDYHAEFKDRILASGLCNDVEFHKTTEAEAARFGIKRPANFLSATVAVLQRNKKKLAELKNKFDQYVSADRARKAEETRKSQAPSFGKRKKTKASDDAKQRIAGRLKNRRLKGPRARRG